MTYDLSKLKEYERQIITAYENYSIVQFACAPVKISQSHERGKFLRLGNRLKIEKDILLNESHSVDLTNLGIGVAHGETKTVVNDITKSTTIRKIDSYATEDLLINAVFDQIDRGYNPRFVFVPIDYFLDIWKWSTARFRRGNFDGLGGYEWIIDNQTRLKVKYSNIHTPFENFIIVDPAYNIWNYRQTKTGGRLTASFEESLEDSENFYLNVHTVFKFDVTEPAANLVLKFKPKEKE